MLDHAFRFDRPEFSSQVDAEIFLRDLQGHGAIKNVTYCGFFSLTDQKSQDTVLITTCPKRWIDRYFLKNYQDIDPAIAFGMKMILPYDWNQIPRDAPIIRQFFDEATYFGVGNMGVSFPIHGACGEKAVFSVTSDLSTSEWHNFREEATAYLFMLAYQFHKNVLSIGEKEQSRPPHLGPREREVLAWASKGKTIWETASILGLQENTVSFYLKSAIAKLRAANKTHAVAEALRLRILP